jgi:hypothetical protein
MQLPYKSAFTVEAAAAEGASCILYLEIENYWGFQLI